MTVEKYIKNEMHMQKLRWATPIGLVLLGCIVTAGFGFMGWCGDTAVKSLENHFDNIDKKQDVLFEKISAISTKENNDIICLTKNLYQCCGSKASLNC